MIMKRRWHWFFPFAVGVFALLVLVLDDTVVVRTFAAAALLLTVAGSWLIARGQ